MRNLRLGIWILFCFALAPLASKAQMRQLVPLAFQWNGVSEFRYGSDLDALGSFDAGTYAYWMAAGIPVDCDQAMVENCIALFCTENLAE